MSYVDTDAINHVVKLDGRLALDRISDYAAQKGYKVAITDVVNREIGLGIPSVSNTTRSWLNDNGIIPERTVESVKIREGHSPSKSGGDRSIVEAALKTRELGGEAAVLSDDGFFAKSQNIVKGGVPAFGPQGEGVFTNADMLKAQLADKFIDDADCARLRDDMVKFAPQFDPESEFCVATFLAATSSMTGSITGMYQHG
jgi:rRNA-processing protein FCF1